MTTLLLRTLVTAYSVPRLPNAVAAPRVAARRSLFGRVIDAIKQANQRRAEREIARFIELRGGRLTDEVERDISRRFGSAAGEVR